jgi:enoyl-CoA hydratase/carnithine racemase
VESIAHRIASFDPGAVRKAKEAVLKGSDLSLQNGLDLEKRLVSELAVIRGTMTATVAGTE